MSLDADNQKFDTALQMRPRPENTGTDCESLNTGPAVRSASGPLSVPTR